MCDVYRTHQGILSEGHSQQQTRYLQSMRQEIHGSRRLQDCDTAVNTAPFACACWVCGREVRFFETETPGTYVIENHSNPALVGRPECTMIPVCPNSGG